jgi:hypothetical protein
MFCGLHDGLLGVCAWYWFGASGLALLLLWRLARRERSGPTDLDWRMLVESDELRFAHLTPWRVLLVGRGWRRCEIFRDELNDEDWARLRRLCIGRQPATGCSTSS